MPCCGRPAVGSFFFLLLPRLLLHRPARRGKSPKVGRFRGGEWASLLASVQESSTRGGQAFCRRQRRSIHDATENMAARAEALSAPRQALERGAVDPGNTATLAALQNPQRRPPILRDSMPALQMSQPSRA